jgi:hypothetical protein
VRNWAVRDYGNRVGIWRIIEALTRYGIRGLGDRATFLGAAAGNGALTFFTKCASASDYRMAANTKLLS